MADNELNIYIAEADNAESFKLYDQSTWTAFSNANVALVNLKILYNGNYYEDKLYDVNDATNEIGLDGTYTNLFGTSSNSFYSVLPNQLENGSTPLSTTHFPDAYYEITLEVTYSAEDKTDTVSQGFLSETYLIASQLPFTIDLSNFNYNENRMQFLAIALLNSCKWAGELGRENQFKKFTEKVNSFLDARNISDLWFS